MIPECSWTDYEEDVEAEDDLDYNLHFNDDTTSDAIITPSEIFITDPPLR